MKLLVEVDDRYREEVRNRIWDLEHANAVFITAFASEPITVEYITELPEGGMESTEEQAEEPIDRMARENQGSPGASKCMDTARIEIERIIVDMFGTDLEDESG